MIPTVATERLLLRGWTDDDRRAWAAMHADPAVMATLGPLLDRAAADALLDRVVARWRELGYGWWCLDRDGECVGVAGVTTPAWDVPFAVAGAEHGRPCFDVGWRLASGHWGHGYATEAARASIEFAFDELAADEVVAMTAEGNTRSRAVMEHLGMVRDPSADFDHPLVPDDSPLRRHVLYRLRADPSTG